MELHVGKLSSQNENQPIHWQRSWRLKNSSGYLIPLSFLPDTEHSNSSFPLGHATRLKHFGPHDKAIHSGVFHT